MAKSNSQRQKEYRERQALKGRKGKHVHLNSMALEVIEKMKSEGESDSDVINYLINAYRETLNWKANNMPEPLTVEDLKNNLK